MPASIVSLLLLVTGPATLPLSGAVGAPVQPGSGVWPLEPRPVVVATFDPPDAPWGAGHRGVDLLGYVGQSVRSALPGTVSFAGSVAGRAVVVVDHGTVRTTYQPVVARLAVGTVVAAGTTIGTLTWRGSHCLPRACLHWGLREGERTYHDPLVLVGCGVRPVRLLPLEGPVPRDGCDPAAPVGLRPPAADYREVALAAVRTALMLVGAPAGRPLGAGPG